MKSLKWGYIAIRKLDREKLITCLLYEVQRIPKLEECYFNKL